VPDKGQRLESILQATRLSAGLTTGSDIRRDRP